MNNSSKFKNENLILGKVNATVGINKMQTVKRVFGPHALRPELINMIEASSKFKLFWYVFFILFAIIYTIIVPESYIYNIDLIVLMVNLDLLTRGKVIGVYVGMVECLIYGYISYSTGLYGEMFKALGICLVINIFTCINWSLSKKKLKESKLEDSSDIAIKKFNKKSLIMSLLLLGSFYGLSILLLKFVFQQKILIYINALTLALMLLYKVLSATRYMESWIFSFIHDAISIILWLCLIIGSTDYLIEIPVLFTMLSAFTNDLYAYIVWRSINKRMLPTSVVILSKRKINIQKVIKLRREFQKLKWNKTVDNMHSQNGVI